MATRTCSQAGIPQDEFMNCAEFMSLGGLGGLSTLHGVAPWHLRPLWGSGVCPTASGSSGSWRASFDQIRNPKWCHTTQDQDDDWPSTSEGKRQTQHRTELKSNVNRRAHETWQGKRFLPVASESAASASGSATSLGLIRWTLWPCRHAGQEGANWIKRRHKSRPRPLRKKPATEHDLSKPRKAIFISLHLSSGRILEASLVAIFEAIATSRGDFRGPWDCWKWMFGAFGVWLCSAVWVAVTSSNCFLSTRSSSSLGVAFLDL